MMNSGSPGRFAVHPTIKPLAKEKWLTCNLHGPVYVLSTHTGSKLATHMQTHHFIHQHQTPKNLKR